MTRPSNREIEQYYFTQFRSHFPLPTGEAEQGDKPDVVIHGEHQLGIEITNLYLTDGSNPGSEQVQRERRETVLHKAQTRHFRAGHKKIELTVAFDSLHPIRDVNDVNAVASALATIAQSIQHLQVGAIPRHYFEHIPWLQFIYHNPREYSDPRWRVSQVFTVPNLSVDRVAQIVATKEERLSDYSPCDAYWLLIVADFSDPAQDQEITWPIECAPINTSYERVIIYKPQFAQWTDIPVQRVTTYPSVEGTSQEG